MGLNDLYNALVIAGDGVVAIVSFFFGINCRSQSRDSLLAANHIGRQALATNEHVIKYSLSSISDIYYDETRSRLGKKTC